MTPSAPRLKAVLLDLDGTLHDKDATLRMVAARQHGQFGLRSLGVPAPAWEQHCLTLNRQSISKADVFAQLQARFALPDALAAALREDFDAHLGAAAVPGDGAHQLLMDCRAAGLKLAVVSNGRDAFQRSKLDGMGFTPLVDAVLTSGGLGIRKPDPRIFLAALNALAVPVQNAAMVGDDWDADMAPALAMGLRAVWRTNTAAPGPVFHSHSLDAIRRFLLRAA